MEIVNVKLHLFLTPTFHGDERSKSRSGSFTSENKISSIYRIGDYVDPRAGLDMFGGKKTHSSVPGFEPRNY